MFQTASFRRVQRARHHRTDLLGKLAPAQMDLRNMGKLQNLLRCAGKYI